jgi:hypothetical protein
LLVSDRIKLAFDWPGQEEAPSRLEASYFVLSSSMTHYTLFYLIYNYTYLLRPRNLPTILGEERALNTFMIICW